MSQNTEVVRAPNDFDDINFTTSKNIEIFPSFDSMGLKQELLHGIYAYGEPI